MIKRLVTTNWSACFEAIHAVKTRFQGVIQALNSLTSASENLQTREDAQIIFLSMENFSFTSHLFYWEEILVQINLIQKKLQEPDLDVCVTLMDATKIFFNWNKDRLVSKSKCKEMKIPVDKRTRKRK